MVPLHTTIKQPATAFGNFSSAQMAPKKRASKKRTAGPTVARKAVADATATALFVLLAAPTDELAKYVGPIFGLSRPAASLALVIILLIAMPSFQYALGGALFNPANNAFQYALGQGTAQEHLVRAVAQACGGVAGALLALAVLPVEWAKGLSNAAVGVRPGITLLDGAACEFVLGSLLAFIVLYSGTLKNRTLALWLPLFGTVMAVKAGGHISGPSLNPAFTFAWLFCFPKQSPAEHFLVFWIAPIASGIFGGWAFRGWQQFLADSEQRQHRKKE